MKNFLISIFLIFIFSCKSVDQKKSLFNGEDLTGWEISNFGGEGEVTVKDGKIFMDYGFPLTGITFTEEFPSLNYSVELEVMKIAGNDFILGLTFPYKESHMTLILGGWGGSLCGLSSINYVDASENETAFIKNFEKNSWYKVKLVVKDDRIAAYLDSKKVIDLHIDGRRVHTRPEVDPSKPLGLAAFETQVMYKNIYYEKLNE